MCLKFTRNRQSLFSLSLTPIWCHYFLLLSFSSLYSSERRLSVLPLMLLFAVRFVVVLQTIVYRCIENWCFFASCKKPMLFYFGMHAKQRFSVALTSSQHNYHAISPIIQIQTGQDWCISNGGAGFFLSCVSQPNVPTICFLIPNSATM